MNPEKLKELLKGQGLAEDVIDNIIKEASTEEPKPAEGEGEGGEPTPNPEGEGKNPEGEPQGEPAPEGEGEGTNPVEGEPQPNEPEGGEPNGEPQGTEGVEPEGEGQPAPEGEPQPAEPNPEGEPNPADPNPNPEPNPEPAVRTVTYEEYEEVKKALEGLGARFDALEKSLAESGVVREASPQVGFKTPEAHDDRHDDEGWDDLLGAMNGR